MAVNFINQLKELIREVLEHLDQSVKMLRRQAPVLFRVLQLIGDQKLNKIQPTPEQIKTVSFQNITSLTQDLLVASVFIFILHGVALVIHELPNSLFCLNYDPHVLIFNIHDDFYEVVTGYLLNSGL